MKFQSVIAWSQNLVEFLRQRRKKKRRKARFPRARTKALVSRSAGRGRRRVECLLRARYRDREIHTLHGTATVARGIRKNNFDKRGKWDGPRFGVESPRRGISIALPHTVGRFHRRWPREGNPSRDTGHSRIVRCRWKFQTHQLQLQLAHVVVSLVVLEPHHFSLLTSSSMVTIYAVYRKTRRKILRGCQHRAKLSPRVLHERSTSTTNNTQPHGIRRQPCVSSLYRCGRGEEHFRRVSARDWPIE